MPNSPEMDADAAARSEASARAQAKLGFFRHLLTYALVIGCLFAINLSTDARYLWFLWPAFGWGIGLIAHAINVFAFSEDMLQRMTDRELRRRRLRSRTQQAPR